VKRVAAFSTGFAALVGLGITLFLFYPGFLSWDSAYQWWQVRHGFFDIAHPPIMVIIWRCTNALLPGPGGYFVFQTVLYWLALALFVSALKLKPWLKILFVLGLGFWPPLWGLSLHLWKDIGTSSFFCLAAACLAHDYYKPKRTWRLVALLCVVLACLYRYNALSAGIMFIIYIVNREVTLPFLVVKHRKKIVAAYSFILLIVIQLILMSPAYLLKLKAEPLWPLQAQWDIAAVSVYENQLLFPPGWVSPKLNMAILKRDFDPSVNVPLFNSGFIYINPYYTMSEQDYDVLKNAWLRLPIDHPAGYFHHRWYVTKNLFAWEHDPEHANFIFSPGIVEYQDNPKIGFRQNSTTGFMQAKLLSITQTPLFFGWVYALLATLVLGRAWRKKNALAAMLSLSALSFALPLLVLAPSCDFRYLAWLVQGSLLALLAVFALPADMPAKR
jgi:hypothetical protein